jgi:hypothetical protein
VGGWQALGHGANGCIALVEFVVEEEVLLVLFIVDDALMDVLRAGKAGDGDNVCCVADFVGDVVDGEGVLVVAVADVTAVVYSQSVHILRAVHTWTLRTLPVGSAVDDALSVVGVAVLGRTALKVWLGWVIHVDVHGTTTASVIATGTTTAAKGNSVVLLLVGADSVGASLDTLRNINPRNIGLDVKGLGVLGRELEQLLHVEELVDC